ncbi:MAG TPA: UDP-N-acetylmuramate dehydrogenase [Candidatus Omnitrophota bacterium]|nr:UDP-N-acetylmuramate dehydrogenase [Candidatus Omnitrophota bacterium]
MESIIFPLSHEIIKNARLSDYTTFRLGGACKGLINCETPRQLIDAVKELYAKKEKFILIGGGSNLVVADEGLDCHVIRYFSKTPYIEEGDNSLTVSGSTILDDLAVFAAELGYEGINTCSGIPGTVGGAVVGNAGAFGKQIGDMVKSVSLLSSSGTLRTAQAKECGFSYRHSKLKETGDIVVDVTLSFKEGDPAELLKEREGILKTRHEKHPDLAQEPCAGSFFRNIEPTSKAGKRQATGWFLEQAGGKSLKSGGAYIFPKHANIIIKRKNGTAKDVFELHKMMAALAKEKFNLDLIREVRFVGKIHGMPKSVKSIIW